MQIASVPQGGSIPDGETEGAMQIGIISNLMFPFDFPKPEQSFGFSAITTREGAVSVSDRGNDGKMIFTRFTIPAGRANMARLINHLQQTVRTNDITVIPPSDAYLFGIGYGSGGTYTCKMLNEVLQVSQVGWNNFELPLNFYLKNFI